MTESSENREYGTARRFFLSESIEAVLLEIAADWHSSIHLHRHKSNEFIVLSGELEVISQQRSSQRWTSEVLRPNCGRFVIPPGINHAFYSREDVVAIEIYRVIYGSRIDVDDIERFGQRGRGKLIY